LRVGPLSSPCRAGNVKILRGAWNVELFRILEGFPDLAHDDEVDVSSGSLEILNLPCTAANFCSKNAAAMAHHITDAYV
jgi:phage terminase large subunit-like protein